MNANPLSLLYGLGVSLRNRRYDRNPRAARRLPAPVVSVGNVTVGGSGKTPLVAAIARLLLRRGERVAVLSRGYGRRSSSPFVLVSDGSEVRSSCEEAGDEPLELARAVSGLTVAVGPDRYEVGRQLLERLGPSILLLDDGFQHRRLHRDLDLVCLDAREPEESLSLLPSGRLREPLDSLRRAHALIWTRCEDGLPAPRLEELARSAGGGIVELRTRQELKGFTRRDRPGDRLGPGDLRDRPVGLLLGVARPERVRESVPARVVFDAVRRDHYWWRREEVAALAEEAKGRGAVALLTTGKDAVKIDAEGLALPLYTIDVETDILDAPVLSALLERVTAR